MKTKRPPSDAVKSKKEIESLGVPLPKPKKRKEYVPSPETLAKKEQWHAKKAVEKYEQRKAYASKKLKEKQEKSAALKEVQAVLQGNKVLIEEDVLEAASPQVTEGLEVIFQPNPGPQTTFFEASDREVLYGGAAGGGKSVALIIDVIRDADNPNHKGIIFRRRIDELRSLIALTKKFYPQIYPGCKWNKQESTWTFPSGATVWYTYLENEDDVERYQGQDFNYIGFDELTQWATRYCWDYMRSRLRTDENSGLKLYMRATANPGGVGGFWVKKMFIDPAKWGEAFWATDIETGRVLIEPALKLDGTPNPRAGQPLFKRRFIPAKLSDNPFLYKDGEYEKNLLSLPEAQRKRLLEGDWDVVDGAAFPEFNRFSHVCEPFPIPESWFKFRGMDYGYTDHACVLWMAVDHEGRIYVYRELYIRGKTVDEVGDLIQEMEKGERIRYGMLDSSMWDNRGNKGPLPAEVLNKRRLNFRPADGSPGSRIAGKLQMHQRLRPAGARYLQDDQGNMVEIPGPPMLQIFPSCINLIRTLPSLPTDKHKPEDVDTDMEDHAYDACRYGIMSRPMKPEFGFFRSQMRMTARGPHCSDNTFGY